MTSDPSSAENDAIGVLICDDVPAMRDLLRALIERDSGLHVVGEARDGNEAISQAKRMQPHVILLDLSMPRRSGLDALPEIRAVAPAAEVVAFSGLESSVVEKNVLRAGASRFLQKGAHPDGILAAIAEAGAVSRGRGT